MEADVVLAAERARIGQGGRGHELIQLQAAAQPVNQQRLQLGCGRLLHQGDQGFQLAERQACGRLFRMDAGLRPRSSASAEPTLARSMP